jgi:hypothetical protein
LAASLLFIDRSGENYYFKQSNPIEGGMSKKSTPRKDWREERRMRDWELQKQG